MEISPVIKQDSSSEKKGLDTIAGGTNGLTSMFGDEMIIPSQGSEPTRKYSI